MIYKIYPQIFRILLVLTIILLTNFGYSQCIWTTIDFDDFEAPAPIPYVDDSQIYGNGTHSAGAYNGAAGLWLNVQNGFSPQLELYNRPYTVCPGQDYQFTAWIGGTDGADYSVDIYDGTNINGVPIATYNSFDSWVFQTIGPITPVTTTLSFVIRNNIAGGVGSNDFRMDDLSLQVCMPVFDTAINLCSGDATINLFDSLNNPSGTAGTWSGPGILTNGYLGSFDPSATTPGIYTYSESCPDRNNNITVNITSAPTVVASATPGTICPGDSSQLDVIINSPTFTCQETSTATGLDIDLTSTTINTFPCVPANSTITDMVLGASIGTNCYLTGNSWYLYDIYINGILAFSDQCDQTGLSLTAFLPITSVELRAKDDPADGIQDNITLVLTLDLTYSPNTNYNFLWTPNAGTLSNDAVAGPFAFPTVNTTYTVAVSDLSNSTCVSTDDIAIAIGNCACPNFSGTMDLAPLNLCGTQEATAIFNNDSILGSGDNFIFVLHDSSSTNLGTVLATSTTPSFSFVSPTLSYGTTYYISAITGDDDLAGGIDYSDTCLSVSLGTPVVWNILPINLGEDTAFCQGNFIMLDAGSSFDNYLWNDNSNGQTLSANTSGEYWVQGFTMGDNLVSNGDFEAGNTGFTTDYSVGTGGAWGPVSNPGTYLITNNANIAHNNFPNCTDHTSGIGNMIVVNGADIANQNVWCQTISVNPNSDYEFSTWVQNYDLPNPAQLAFYINGVQLGTTFSPTSAGCTWENFFEIWNSGAATSAQICIVNQSLAGGGNDFSLDDISFTTLCTSTDTITVTVNTAPTSTDTQIACSTFTWIDGNTYTSSNSTATYTIIAGANNGCDSIVTLNLTITGPVNSIDTQSACDSFIWIDGNTYTTDNSTAMHTIFGGANNGCDSIVTLNLTILNPTNGVDVITSCSSINWIDGNTYSTDNSTASHTITGGANNGCDSIVTLNLTITNAVIGTDVQTACITYDWIDGNTYTSSNSTATHTITGGASNGCDSIVSLNLTIMNAANSQDIQSACNSIIWIDGNTYNTNNNTAIHTFIGGASNGCDSIVTLNLTITNGVSGIDYQTSCIDYLWIDGITYSTSNNTATHTFIGGSSNGCDSTVTLNLTISPNIIINLGADYYVCDEAVTLSPGTGYSTYTWSNSSTGASLITNEYGTYHVTVTDIDGCIGYDEIEIIKECPANLWVPNVFSPNGDSKNEIFSAVGDNLTSFTLKVFNRWGNLLFETNSIDNGWDGTFKGSKVSSGTYVYLIDYSYKEKQNTVNKTLKGAITLLK